MGISIGVKTDGHVVLSSAKYGTDNFEEFISDMLDDCAECLNAKEFTVNGIKLSNIVILVGEDAKLREEPQNWVASVFTNFPYAETHPMLYGNAVICGKNEFFGYVPLTDIEASTICELLDHIKRNLYTTSMGHW